jgi:glycosyltransferase involved in cell wall biosynthesis
MRIAHVVRGRCNPESNSGIDRMVYHLSRAQAAAGHEVAIFSVTAKPSIPIEGVHVFTQPPSPWSLLPRRELGDSVRAWKPDVTHLHSLYIPEHTALGRRLRGWQMPYVVTPHGGLAPHVLRSRPLLKRSYRALFERSYLNHAAFVHAVTEREDLQGHGVTAPVIRAPNGVSVADLPASLDAGIIERRYPAARGNRIFVAVGRLDPVLKGLDLLIQAFCAPSVAGRPLFLVLVGPDHRDGRAQLERLVRDAGAEDRVVFWGPALGDEKFDVLAAADIFVQASRSEGISIAVLEALATAKPCLVSTAADPLGRIAARNAGLVTKPEVDELSAAIVRYAEMSDEELRARGERGRDIVTAEFEWTTIAQTLLLGYTKYAVRQ